MLLHESSESYSIQATAENGTKFPLLEVMKASLNYIRGHAIDEVNKGTLVVITMRCHAVYFATQSARATPHLRIRRSGDK